MLSFYKKFKIHFFYLFVLLLLSVTYWYLPNPEPTLYQKLRTELEQSHEWHLDLSLSATSGRLAHESSRRGGKFQRLYDASQELNEWMGRVIKGEGLYDVKEYFVKEAGGWKETDGEKEETNRSLKFPNNREVVRDLLAKGKLLHNYRLHTKKWFERGIKATTAILQRIGIKASAGGGGQWERWFPASKADSIAQEIKCILEEASQRSQFYLDKLSGCTAAQALTVLSLAQHYNKRIALKVFRRLEKFLPEQSGDWEVGIYPWSEQAYQKPGDTAQVNLYFMERLDAELDAEVELNARTYQGADLNFPLHRLGEQQLIATIKLKNSTTGKTEVYKKDFFINVIEPAVQLHALQPQRLYLNQPDTFELLGTQVEKAKLKGNGLKIERLSARRYILHPQALGPAQVEAVGSGIRRIFEFEVFANQ